MYQDIFVAQVHAKSLKRILFVTKITNILYRISACKFCLNGIIRLVLWRQKFWPKVKSNIIERVFGSLRAASTVPAEEDGKDEERPEIPIPLRSFLLLSVFLRRDSRGCTQASFW